MINKLVSVDKRNKLQEGIEYCNQITLIRVCKKETIDHILPTPTNKKKSVTYFANLVTELMTSFIPKKNLNLHYMQMTLAKLENHFNLDVSTSVSLFSRQNEIKLCEATQK